MTVLLAAESTLGHAEEAELHMPVSYLLQNVCSLVEGAFSRIVVISVKVLRGALWRWEIQVGRPIDGISGLVFTQPQRVWLWEFTAKVHEIDSGDAPSIKEKMRRTPANFGKEEETHLKKMLGAGIIQSSVSEWVSVPLQIEKKDGQVRWCLDHRRLNNVARKDILSGSVWF